MTRMRTAVVGAFVLGGLLLFGGGLFLIGDRRLLFVDQFELNSTSLACSRARTARCCVSGSTPLCCSRATLTAPTA